jgi:hypothetical protein
MAHSEHDPQSEFWENSSGRERSRSLPPPDQGGGGTTVASLQPSCSHQTFLNTSLATMPPARRDKNPQSTPKRCRTNKPYTYLHLLRKVQSPSQKPLPEVCVSQNLLRKTSLRVTFTKRLKDMTGLEPTKRLKDMTGLEPRCLINDRLHPRRAVHAITNEEEA